MSVELRWFPQSFVQLAFQDSVAYIDPSITDSFKDLVKLALPPHRPARLPDGLRPGELVLFTHSHLDHLDPAMATALAAQGAAVLAPQSCRRKLGARMTPVTPGDRRTAGRFGIEAVEAYNPEGSRVITYHPRGAGVGYIVTVAGLRIYHAGDTGLIDGMKNFGAIDVALLPIGGKFTMDIPEAVEAVRIIRPRIAVPMHMLKADPLEFKCRAGDPGTEVQVLVPGGRLSLEPRDGDNKV